MDHLYSPLVALAAGGSVSPLADLGLCLVAAAALAIAFVKLRIPAIAALLGAGVVLGPAGLEAIGDRASIDTIATLGLTLLLYVIGLEVTCSGRRPKSRSGILPAIYAALNASFPSYLEGARGGSRPARSARRSDRLAPMQ